MQKSRGQPQSSVMLRRFRKRGNCCHVIANPQAGIAAPTLAVMQGSQAKKKIAPCISSPILRHSVHTPYTSIPRVQSPSANRTRLRWLEGEHVNHYTTPVAPMQCQNAVFKGGESSSKFRKGNRGLRLICFSNF